MTPAEKLSRVKSGISRITTAPSAAEIQQQQRQIVEDYLLDKLTEADFKTAMIENDWQRLRSAALASVLGCFRSLELRAEDEVAEARSAEQRRKMGLSK